MDKLYKRKEAAEYLGISITTLDELRRGGLISFFQYTKNGLILFSENHIAEFLKKSEHKSVPSASASALSDSRGDEITTFRKRRK